MLTSSERESFALEVMDEVRRWPGVEIHPHASGTEPNESDGVEFRLYGRQIGHVHSDCAVHLLVTKALRQKLIDERLAEPLDAAPRSTGWAMFNPIVATDADRAVQLLRLNYVRLRRQRLSPAAAASNEMLQKHEAQLGKLSPAVRDVVRKTQARSAPRPLPGLEA